MLADDDQGRTSLEIVLNIDDGVDSEVDVSAAQGVLFVPEGCVVVGFVDIIHHAFEVVHEPGESVLIEPVLQLLQEHFGVLGFG